MFARREYHLLRSNFKMLKNIAWLKSGSNSLFKRSSRFFSSYEDVEDDFEECREVQDDQDSADAFPVMNLIPEELLRDLAEKKRMRKLEVEENKKKISLAGVFPEIIFDANLGEEALN